MKILFSAMRLVFLAAIFLVFTTGVKADPTNTLSEAEVEGQLFVQKILAQMPPENYSNSATLRVRAKKGEWTNYVVTSRVLVGRDYWKNIFTSDALAPAHEVFTVTHTLDQPNAYIHEAIDGESEKMLPSSKATPFAGSDFWLGDLALDFFHWPEQRVLKKEFHRECSCTVLESVNPHPEPNGYSRMVSWIDNDTLAVIDAYAYDAGGKRLKELSPISVKKVNGQYQVKEIEIQNVQTGSRTQLEFDLK